MRRLIIIPALYLLVSSCNSAADKTNPASAKDSSSVTVKTRHYELTIDTIISKGLDGPWAVEYASNGRALITGKKGELYRMIDNKLDTQKITGLPKVYAYDLVGGLMDIAIDPDYKENGWVYLAFSHNPKNSGDKNEPGMTKIVRGKIKNHKWTEEQSLFSVVDSLLVKGGMRWGARMLFDRQGYLYFSIGDMQGPKQSGRNPQLLTRPEGKIFRINRDGSIPKDNPLYGKNNTLQAIYAWGTRNVQGMALDSATGNIYFTDHGPQGGDELNLLKKGANYGWPLITYGIDYDSSIISKDTAMDGMEQPLIYWTPSIAVCAAEYINQTGFPAWKNNILVTSLKSGELRRLVIENGRVTEQEILLKSAARVRDAKIFPDGNLYVLTNSPDALLRIRRTGQTH